MIPSSLLPIVAAPALILSPVLSPITAPRAAIGDSERAALTAACDPSLGSRRAGDASGVLALARTERAEILRAQASAAELGSKRAGELNLNDRELTIIGIILLAVLIIAVVS